MQPQEPQLPVEPQQPTSVPAPEPQPTPAVQPQPVVAPTQPVAASSLPVAELPTKRRFPKWLIVVLSIFAALAVFVAVVSLIAASATKDAQIISDKFIADVQSNSPDSAYSLTSDAFKKATSQDQLSSVITSAGPQLQGKFTITGRNIMKSSTIPETAVLVYSVNTTSGTKYIKTELQKNGNVWQIISFKSSNSALDTAVE